MVLPILNIYHIAEKIEKNIHLSSTYMVTKLQHLIANKTCNIACKTVKFGILLPVSTSYHSAETIDKKKFICRPRIRSRNVHN